MRSSIAIGIGLVAVAALTGGGLFASGALDAPLASIEPASGGQAAPSAPASRIAVAALGRIEPESEIIDVAAPIIDRLDRLVVVEGDLVRAGQPLGYLGVHDERRADRDEIAAELAEARRRLAAETALGEAEIRAAAVKVAEVGEIYPLRIAMLEAKVRSLEVQLVNNLDILNSRRELFESNMGPRRAFADQRTIVRQNEEDLSMARAEIAQLRASMRIDGEKAAAELARAKAALGRATAAVAVESLEKKLELAEARLAQAEVRAPIDGRILKVLTRPGERKVDSPILKMGNTARMHAVAEVYETDVRFVREGQRASVRSPALSRALTGKVVKIGNLIYKNDVLDVDPAANTDRRVVEVRIALDDGGEVARLTNLTVDVVIDVTGARGAPETALR
jgi:HlyD family secretion protein